MFILLIVRKSNIFSIGTSSLLLVKMKNLAVFSGSDSYVLICFLRCVAMKITVFLWLQEYLFDCLISAAVTYKDWHSQSDRLSC